MIDYLHTKEIDQYFNSNGSSKIRVTVDQNTGQVI